MCARCEELEERVAWLESELGLQRDASTTERLRTALLKLARDRGMVPNRGFLATAEAVLVLYRAKGRLVTRLQLLEAIPPKAGGEDERNLNIASVWISSARTLLPAGTFATLWGHGFRLTDAGLATVAELIGDAADHERRAA